MSTNQAIQTAQPTWDDLVRVSKEWVTDHLYCIRCGSVLVSSPEPEGHEWFIRCLSCQAKNVLIVTLRVVGWRL
jgi:hypothetical protein